MDNRRVTTEISQIDFARKKSLLNFSSDELRAIPIAQRISILSQLIEQFIEAHKPYDKPTTLEIFYPKNIHLSFKDNKLTLKLITLERDYNDTEYFDFYKGAYDYHALIGLISLIFPEKIDQYYHPLSLEQSTFVKTIHIFYKELSVDNPNLSQISHFCHLLCESIPRNPKELAQLEAKVFATEPMLNHIFILAQENGFYDQIPNNIIAEVETFSRADLNRLNTHVGELAKYGLLDLESFMLVLQKINLRFNKLNAHQVDITQEPKNISYHNKSTNSFFISETTSAFAKIYSASDKNKPMYILKKTSRGESSERIYAQRNTRELVEDSAFRAAIKETKYHSLFNKNTNTFYFKSSDSIDAMVPFIEGIPLDKLKNINKYSFEKRLKLFASILEKINILHEKYRIHGDLFSRNIMINPETLEANLFDFETTHRPGTLLLNKKLFSHTFTTSNETQFIYLEFLENDSIFNRIFPESKTCTDQDSLEILADVSFFFKAHILLIYNNYFNQHKCSTARLLNFTNALVEKFNSFNSRVEIYQLADEMLFNHPLTADDVIRYSM